MWGFLKLQDPTEGIEKLKAFRDIGETFNYLGAKCVVTGHCHYEPCFPGIVAIPTLKFDYRDASGVIRSSSASVEDLPLLISQQSVAAAGLSCCSTGQTD